MTAKPSWWPCDKHPDEEPEATDCHSCGGDGAFDCYEDDPINCPREGVEFEDCRDCDGRGFYWVCPGCVSGMAVSP